MSCVKIKSVRQSVHKRPKIYAYTWYEQFNSVSNFHEFWYLCSLYCRTSLSFVQIGSVTVMFLLADLNKFLPFPYFHTSLLGEIWYRRSLLNAVELLRDPSKSVQWKSYNSYKKDQQDATV